MQSTHGDNVFNPSDVVWALGMASIGAALAGWRKPIWDWYKERLPSMIGRPGYFLSQRANSKALLFPAVGCFVIGAWSLIDQWGLAGFALATERAEQHPILFLAGVTLYVAGLALLAFGSTLLRSVRTNPATILRLLALAGMTTCVGLGIVLIYQCLSIA